MSAEVVALVQVVHEPRLDRPPPEQLAGQSAGGRLVDREYVPNEAELLNRHRRGGQVQMAADDSGDVAGWHPLVADRVQPRSWRRLLDRQTEKVRGIQYVHRGP